MADRLPLAGRTVGVTADRRGGDQVVMFRRLGAAVVHGPTMATTTVPDPVLLRAQTEEITARPPDYLVADTGVGMRTWLASAAGWGLAESLVGALEGSRIAARGPKVTGALASLGLAAWWRSPNGRLGELVDHLVDQGLDGKRVVLQLPGDGGGDAAERLRRAGAAVTEVEVYSWTVPADPAPAMELVERCCAGGLDAVTFTAAPQVRGLLRLAEGAGSLGALVEAFGSGRTTAACIGPVCAAEARSGGLGEPLVPSAWRLGSLVKAVAAALG